MDSILEAWGQSTDWGRLVGTAESIDRRAFDDLAEAQRVKKSGGAGVEITTEGRPSDGTKD